MTSYEKYALIRDEKGLTDYKVAKATGIGTATFSNWKNGKYTPKQDKIDSIANYLGVTSDQIIERKSKNIIRVYNHMPADTHKRRSVTEIFAGAGSIRLPKEEITDMINGIVEKSFDNLLRINEEQLELLENYEMLTDEGRKKVRSYIDDLLLIPKYCQIDDANESDTVNINKIDADVAAHVDNGDFSEEQGIHVSKFSDMTKK